MCLHCCIHNLNKYVLTHNVHYSEGQCRVLFEPIMLLWCHNWSRLNLYLLYITVLTVYLWPVGMNAIMCHIGQILQKPKADCYGHVPESQLHCIILS